MPARDFDSLIAPPSQALVSPKAAVALQMWPVASAASVAAPPPPLLDTPPLDLQSLHQRLDLVETLMANADPLDKMAEKLNASENELAEMRKQMHDLNVELDLLKQAGSNTTNNFQEVDGRLKWLEGAVQPLAGFVLDFTRYTRSAGESFHNWAWRNKTIEQQPAGSIGSVVVAAQPPHKKPRR
jgi:hypothetical protein